jgi:glutathione S-transferase
MDWLAHSVNPHMKAVFMGMVRTPAEQRDVAGIEQANRELTALWSMLERRLDGREFILGDAFSIADIVVAIQANRWLMMVPEHASLPHVERWMGGLRNRPAFKANVEGPLS